MAAELGVGPFEADAPGGRRQRAARGAVINAAFLIGLNGLNLIKGFAVAAFLTASDYGTWGLLIAAFTTVLALAQVGVDDKYVQQREEDQQAAFEVAFTLQCLVSGALVVVVGALLPVAALAYDETSILAPGYVLLLTIAALPFHTPLWTFYRRMDYARQRRLQALDPVCALIVTVALAAAGAGYWALVIGVVSGSLAAAAGAVRASPHRFGWRVDRAAVAQYRGFAVPLFLGGVGASLMSLVPVLVAQRSLGLAAVGVITLATTISNYANRVDEIVTNTLYPVVCAVVDRRDLLLESFTKTNRLALLWAMPLGAAAVLFAPALVEHVLGDRWADAVYPLQALTVAAALNQIGFNWEAFFRALGRTRPLAVGSWAMLTATLAIAVPLLLAEGVDGYATGMVLAVLVFVGVRLSFLRGLFGLRPVLVNTARGIAPTLPALGLVLLARELGGPGPIAELALFLTSVAGATLVLERELVRELRGYLGRG